MATQTIENFNTLDLETLASVEGGLSCDEGMLVVGGLGAVGGPWGAVGGVLVGAALYCF
ncbi:MAG: Blp family class II bacteriocin [Streptococcus thermophilus]